MVFPIVGGNQSTGDIVTSSLRFNNDDSNYLEKSLSSPNTDKFTVSFWSKISGQRANVFSLGKRLVGATGDYFSFDVDLGTGTGSGRLSVGGYNGNSDSNTLAVNTVEGSGNVMRDVSAWQHHVFAIDTGQGTAGNRFKWYINGVLQSGYNTTTTPSQNVDLFDSSGSAFRIGRLHNDESRYMDGYLAEFYYVDGQQYDHTYFGETSDDGVWVPVEKDKGAGGAITFGTNGFYLQFKQTGTSANASGMGADTSGNDNHLTPSNLAADHVTTDTPQNNFCTLNPNASQGGSNQSSGVATFTEGNLVVDNVSSESITSTFGVNSGKWYWEVKVLTDQDGLAIGAINDHFHLDAEIGYNSPSSPSEAKVFAYYGGNGNKYTTIGDGSQLSSYGSAIAVNNIIGVALNLDDDEVVFYLNGTAQNSGTAFSITALGDEENYFPAIGNWSASAVKLSFNFGNPVFSISSGNSDGAGYGNFEYAVPSGYYSLCTKNIAEYG